MTWSVVNKISFKSAFTSYSSTVGDDIARNAAGHDDVGGVYQHHRFGEQFTLRFFTAAEAGEQNESEALTGC